MAAALVVAASEAFLRIAVCFQSAVWEGISTLQVCVSCPTNAVCVCVSTIESLTDGPEPASHAHGTPLTLCGRCKVYVDAPPAKVSTVVLPN